MTAERKQQIRAHAVNAACASVDQAMKSLSTALQASDAQDSTMRELIEDEGHYDDAVLLNAALVLRAVRKELASIEQLVSSEGSKRE